MPPLERGSDDQWDVRGAMTLEGYQRLRKGYERGINPEALERMEGQGETVQSFQAPPSPYQEPVYSDGEEGEEYAAQNEWSREESEPAPQANYRSYGQEPIGYQETFEPEEPVRQRRIGPITVTLILLVGIVGALLLYAGGIDYISDFFRKSEPVSNENLTLVTERPHAEPEVDPAGAMTPGEEMEMNEHEAEEALDPNRGGAGVETSDAELEVSATAHPALNSASTVPQGATRTNAPLVTPEATAQKVDPKKTTAAASTKPTTPTSTTAAKTATPSQTTPKVIPVGTQKTASTSGAFTVQVRATPNKDEADRVARALRAKGGEDVNIVATEKDGETVYRVRFGSFGSAEEGKAKAETMGFGNVWVIKR